MRLKPISIALLALSLLFNPIAHARNNTHSNPDLCYDENDPNDIRLWNQSAPGAAGEDPCLDIPHMRIFPASGATPSTSAILLVAGGGYDQLTNLKEQRPVAEYFSKQLHISTFVLYYRLVKSDGTYRYPVPMWDGQRALRLIRARAIEFGIDANRIGAFGFSAGGHLATVLAEHGTSNFDLPRLDAIDQQSGQINFLGLGYPVISMISDQYGKSNSREHLLAGIHGDQRKHLDHFLSGQDHISKPMPPVFLFVSMDDQRIDPHNSVLLINALQAAGVPADSHFFTHGAHGVGLGLDEPEEKVWPDKFRQWLTALNLLPY